MEEKSQYVFFQFPRRGKLKRLVTFKKSDYKSYRHFVGGISKFLPYLFFLEQPILIDPLTIHDLDKVFHEQYK